MAPGSPKTSSFRVVPVQEGVKRRLEMLAARCRMPRALQMFAWQQLTAMKTSMAMHADKLCISQRGSGADAAFRARGFSRKSKGD